MSKTFNFDSNVCMYLLSLGENLFFFTARGVTEGYAWNGNNHIQCSSQNLFGPICTTFVLVFYPVTQDNLGEALIFDAKLFEAKRSIICQKGFEEEIEGHGQNYCAHFKFLRLLLQLPFVHHFDQTGVLWYGFLFEFWQILLNFLLMLL